jgi:hypothetical protein
MIAVSNSRTGLQPGELLSWSIGNPDDRMNYAWDGLWKQAFANGQRDPSLTMAVDFDAYVRADTEPSP